MSMLVHEERYSRPLGVLGAEAFSRLRGRRVGVVGGGNLGGQLLPHLAAVGLSTHLVDRGVVREASLVQGFRPDEVGVPKSIARKRQIEGVYGTEVVAVHDSLARLGLGVFAGCDLILCALDSMQDRVDLNAIAFSLGIPWIDGALDGSGRRHLGRVAVHDPDGACMLCPWDVETLQRVREEGRAAGCEGWWDDPGRRGERPAPTLALTALGGAVASVMALQAILLLSGATEGLLQGREMHLDLTGQRILVHRLVRNPRCLFPHHRLRPLTGFDRGATVGALLDDAERRLGPGATLRLHRRGLVTELHCPRCRATPSIARADTALTPEEARCACGGVMEPPGMAILERFDRSEAVAFLGRSWTEVGLPEREVLSAEGRDGEAVHYVL